MEHHLSEMHVIKSVTEGMMGCGEELDDEVRLVVGAG